MIFLHGLGDSGWVPLSYTLCLQLLRLLAHHRLLWPCRYLLWVGLRIVSNDDSVLLSTAFSNCLTQQCSPTLPGMAGQTPWQRSGCHMWSTSVPTRKSVSSDASLVIFSDVCLALIECLYPSFRILSLFCYNQKLVSYFVHLSLFISCLFIPTPGPESLSLLIWRWQCRHGKYIFPSECDSFSSERGLIGQRFNCNLHLNGKEISLIGFGTPSHWHAL